MKLPALAFTVALAGLAGACSSAPPAAAPPAPQIDATVAHATMADFPSQFEAGGVVRAKLTASVSSRVLAPIAEVRVRAGDRVRRGQPLVVLDGRDLQANAVSVRVHGKGSLGAKPRSEVVAQLLADIKNRVG